MAKVKNYARFYALLKQMPGNYNGLKDDLVYSHTTGRTSSLREMTTLEYEHMCDSMQNSVPQVKEADYISTLKRYRSSVLRRLGQLGVDTSDWSAVDNFCMNPRIAGKVFRQLSVDQLKSLVPKLESIMNKKPVKKASEPTVWYIPTAAGLPS